MTDDKQLTTAQDQPPDLAAYYTDSAHSAQGLLQRAVQDADDDYVLLNQNLKAVNAYIKARSSIADLIERAEAVRDPVLTWDPFSETNELDTKLQVVQAKAELTAVTSGESAAVALYQSGLTYKEISGHTGFSQEKVKRLIKKRGIQRERKKAVPIVS